MLLAMRFTSLRVVRAARLVSARLQLRPSLFCSSAPRGTRAFQVDGRTSLFDPEAPDFVQFPEARKAQPYSVVVEEGEVARPGAGTGRVWVTGRVFPMGERDCG